MNRIQDMTKGNPLKLIIIFALPLMIGNVFQQLYTVVDTIVVGKALGVDALAALGSIDWLNWTMLGIVQGITQGFSILMAQDYGAKNIKHLNHTICQSILLAIVFSIVLVIGGQIIIKPSFTWLHVPVDISSIANAYLRIMFSGIPIMILYNLSSSILRALGDGKTPLYAMIFASILNIILDILFVVNFHMGVQGAAIATLLAQLIASSICIIKIRKIDMIHLEKAQFTFESSISNKLLYLGLPMAFQNIVIGVGGIIITSIVNKYGVVFIAGYTATNKLYGILEIAAVSFGYALTTYVGQNLGANKINRIREGLKQAILVSLVISLTIAFVMIVFGRDIVSMFLSGEANETMQALEYGYEYLRIMCYFLPILYILHCVRSTLQGAGNTIMPMVSGIMEFIMRTGAALFLPAIIGYVGLFYAEVFAWSGADCILIPSYIYLICHLQKDN